MCHLISFRSLLLSAVCAVSAWAGDGPALEPYLVLNRQAEMFDGTTRVPARLLPGDVLPARPDDQDRDWLQVTFNQKVLQAKAEHFGRLRDLEAAYMNRIVELDSRIAEIERRIAQQDETSERLYAAEHAIGFDATVQYRYRQSVPSDSSGAASGGAPGKTAPNQALQYVDKYGDKIPISRARTLAERWNRERRTAETESAKLREERRECLRDRLSADTQRAYVAGRFAAFTAGAGMMSGEPYVTMKGRTQLYTDTRLAQELDVDVVVMALPNRDDDEWLKVRWNGQILNGRKNGFRNRLGVEEQLGRRAVWLDQALRDKQDEAKALANRRQLLEAIGLAADYAAQVNYVVLHAYPFSRGYRGERYYQPPVSPGDAVEVVNCSRARSFVKACDKEIGAIDTQLLQIDKTLRAWRRELAAVGPRLDDLRRRLDAARWPAAGR